MRFRLSLLILASASGVAAAQTQPGIAFKVRTQLRNHHNVEKSRPDSVRLKRLAAEAAARSGDIDIGGDGPGGARAAAAGGANNVLTMNGIAVKGLHRVDVQGVIGNVELQATQWALFTDTSSTVIDDVQRQYWARVFDIGSILAFTNVVDNAPRRLGTLKVSWDSLPDEMHEGRNTKRYRMTMQYGFVQPAREDSSKLLATTTATSDYWVANLPVNFENRFAGIGRPRRQIPDSLRGEWAKILQLYDRLGRGTIVKFTAAGTIGENAQRATEYTRTMELTGITEVPVDPVRFQIPADFALITLQRGRGGND